MHTTTDHQLEICRTIERQIGRRTILAISGGRVIRLGATTLGFPVSSGYHVEVECVEGRDLYTVRRVFRRGLKHWVKGEVTHVYAEDLPEIAWQASCFNNVDFGGAA